MTETHLTTKQAAAQLGISVPTLCRWVGNGKATPSVKVPGATGAYLFSPTEIERLAAER